jgi:hypothetical protein
LSNKFDSTNYPSNVPSVLQLGDFWAWKKSNLASDYPTADYSLSYEFNLIDGATPANFTIGTTESSDEYIVATSNTSSYTKGEYNWVEYITRTSDNARIKLSEGFTEIQDNYATTTASDQSSMSIAGRSLSRMSIDELFTLKDRYQAEYNKEVKQARIANGQGSGNTIKVKFGSQKTINPTSYT